jgi:SAM-dependent methyltransferase
MSTIELAACPACGTPSSRTFELGPGARLRHCERCGTVSAPEYVDPAEVYVDGYMMGGAGRFGIDVTPPAFQAYLERVAQRRLSLVERACGTRDGSLLDVGCGSGELLRAAHERGWTVQGVEPESSGAQRARQRGLAVVETLLEDSGLPERSYDVVSAFHVLEHQPDSRAFVSLLARWVRPGGHVVVEVPNWHSLQRRRLRERWPALRPGEHLVHFTPQTLRATLSASGIVPVTVRSPVYVGAPQHLEQALWDLARPHGRLARLGRGLSRPRGPAGSMYEPTRPGWWLLRLVEAVHDAAGIGTVVLAVGRVP